MKNSELTKKQNELKKKEELIRTEARNAGYSELEIVDLINRFYQLQNPQKSTTTTSTSTPSTTEPKKKSTLRKVGDVAASIVTDPFKSIAVKPGVRFGQAVGSALIEGFGTEKMKQRANELRQKELKSGIFNVEGTKSGKAAVKQIAGEGLESATNIALFGGAGGGIGTKTALGRITKSAVTGGIVGASGGASGSLKENKDTASVLKNAMVGGALGFAVGGALGVAGEGIRYATKKIPEKIANRTFKSSQKEIKQDLTYKGESFGKQTLDRKIFGNDQKIVEDSTRKVAKFENQLQDKIRKDGKNVMVKREDIAKYFDDLIKQKEATPGQKEEVRVIKQIIDEFPDEVPLLEVNKIKRNLYHALTDTAFRLDPSLSTKREAMKTMARGLKKEVEKNAVDDAGREIIKSIERKTVGMKPSYEEAGVLTEGSKLPKELTDRIISDVGADLKRLGKTDALKRIITKLSGKEYKTLEQLQSKLLAETNEIAAINQELAFFGKLQEKAIDRIARNLQQPIIGGQTTMLGAGSELLRRPTALRTGVAITLDQIGKMIDRLPVDAGGKISKSALFNIIQEAAKRGNKEK